MPNLDDVGLYSDRDITRIVAATGLKNPPKRFDMLRARLEQAAENLRLRNIVHKEPTARKLRDKFQKIEDAASNLLSELGAGPDGGLSEIKNSIIDRLQLSAIKKAKPLGKSGRSLLQGSVDGVVQLKRWAKSLANSEAEQENKRRELSNVENPRRSKNHVLKYWINDLSKIYQDIWEQEPTLYWDDYTETYIGEFLKFVQAAGEAIGVEKGDHALATIIRRAKNIKVN